MTMLHLLKSLQAGWNFGLRVVHVNHGTVERKPKGIRRWLRISAVSGRFRAARIVNDVPQLSEKWKLGTEETGRIVRRKGV